jgi:glycosyltransferase involved in cell wall biosynthesis
MNEPSIFYYCYSHERPSGGQKHTYQHVDILNRHGYKAFAFHTQKDFRLTWFDNETKVIDFESLKAIYDKERDYLVLPEDLGTKLLEFPGKKVVFNKNVYHGFQVFGSERPPFYPYLDPQLACIFAVSEHNREYLSFAYPHVKVIKVDPGIDANVFTYNPIRRKKRMIACILKAPAMLLTLYHALQSRADAGLNDLKDYEWVFLDGRTEKEVAEVLRDALIFIFTSVEEGLGRMPLEAMLSGSLVAGFASGPLKEYMPLGSMFEVGDMLGMARFVESITGSFPGAEERWQQLSEAGRDKALAYSLKQQETSVIAAWEQILSGAS